MASGQQVTNAILQIAARQRNREAERERLKIAKEQHAEYMKRAGAQAIQAQATLTKTRQDIDKAERERAKFFQQQQIENEDRTEATLTTLIAQANTKLSNLQGIVDNITSFSQYSGKGMTKEMIDEVNQAKMAMDNTLQQRVRLQDAKTTHLRQRLGLPARTEAERAAEMSQLYQGLHTKQVQKAALKEDTPVQQTFSETVFPKQGFVGEYMMVKASGDLDKMNEFASDPNKSTSITTFKSLPALKEAVNIITDSTTRGLLRRQLGKEGEAKLRGSVLEGIVPFIQEFLNEEQVTDEKKLNEPGLPPSRKAPKKSSSLTAHSFFGGSTPIKKKSERREFLDMDAEIKEIMKRKTKSGKRPTREEAAKIWSLQQKNKKDK